MGSNSATHHHGLSNHPVLDIRCTDWKCTTDHQAIERDIDTKEYNLSMDIALLKLAVNRADALTHVLQC